MAALTEDMFSDVDIDAHLSKLRRMKPSTDPAILASASPRGKAVAKNYADTAHAIADFIDAYRVNGYGAGEAVQSIWSAFLEPISSVPVIDTDAD